RGCLFLPLVARFHTAGLARGLIFSGAPVGPPWGACHWVNNGEQDVVTRSREVIALLLSRSLGPPLPSVKGKTRKAGQTNAAGPQNRRARPAHSPFPARPPGLPPTRPAVPVSPNQFH